MVVIFHHGSASIRYPDICDVAINGMVLVLLEGTSKGIMKVNSLTV